MGNAISPSIDEHYNVSADGVYLPLPAVVTGKRIIKLQPKATSQVFLKALT